MTAEVYDLGCGHTFRYAAWAPDRDLNRHRAHLPDVDRYCVLIEHPRPDNGEPCSGAATLAGPVQAEIEPNKPTWAVEQWDPLTLSPSVLCGACGDHGWIRNGRWEPA